MIRAIDNPAANQFEEFPGITAEVQDDILQFCRLVADGTRFKILLLLTHEAELNVTALCQRLGQSQPAVSHHLAILREGGLIDLRREGKNNFYHICSRDFQELLDQFAPAPQEQRESRLDEYLR